MIKNNISRFLTISFSTIMIFALIGFLIRKQYDFILNWIPIYSNYLLFIYLENKKKIIIKNYIKVLVTITAILHILFGQYFNLYQSNNWFDKGLHVFGTFSFTLFCYSLLNLSIEFFSKSKIFNFILLLSIGTTIGVFLENLEFILDIICKTKNQHSLLDTNLDLIFNIFGAALAGILCTFREI
ncbi:hypothetical protein [Tepidibacter hydrothermalis]|uniref:DUF2238 domain-containing protein n=1 Tax=Tepidibacter hydrothermalis TaxID=3036126 RepID=A0ABY8EIY8_9FIRM|nr:hypothetical protein [Tepidibacter hydrothermalis]WFD10935.1 hypothetical protein P4S50_02350 [Tepidibacter hydrothermalis]